MKALVTGGGGFLGSAVVRKLLEQGMRVRSFSRNFYPELATAGVEQYQGNLASADDVLRAASGCDIVYHIAAKAGVWGKFSGYHRANVIGTQHVIDACLAKGIRKLVHTSTASVVFAGEDLEGVDESIPYPTQFHSFYVQTKVEAEKRVRAANSERLATVILRPHVIWGPGDPVWLPRILERGARGELRIIGDESKTIDTIYVDNAADAHLLAGERLDIGSPVAGQTYFISDDDPVHTWDMINRVLEAGNLPPVQRRVPARVAKAAGFLMETVYGLLRIEDEPRLTRFAAQELSSSHWFDIGAAKRDLGYRPQVTMDEGFERLRAWLRTQQTPDTDPGRERAA